MDASECRVFAFLSHSLHYNFVSIVKGVLCLIGAVRISRQWMKYVSARRCSNIQDEQLFSGSSILGAQKHENSVPLLFRSKCSNFFNIRPCAPCWANSVSEQLGSFLRKIFADYDSIVFCSIFATYCSRGFRNYYYKNGRNRLFLQRRRRVHDNRSSARDTRAFPRATLLYNFPRTFRAIFEQAARERPRGSCSEFVGTSFSKAWTKIKAKII